MCLLSMNTDSLYSTPRVRHTIGVFFRPLSIDANGNPIIHPLDGKELMTWASTIRVALGLNSKLFIPIATLEEKYNAKANRKEIELYRVSSGADCPGDRDRLTGVLRSDQSHPQ
jgi:hypothetical protein